MAKMESTETKIAVLNNRMINVEQKVDEGFKSAREEMVKLNTKMDEFIEAADKRYASKLSETVVWGVVSIIGLGVIGAILNLILK